MPKILYNSHFLNLPDKFISMTPSLVEKPKAILFYLIISCMFCSGFCGIVSELALFTLSESLIGGTTTDLLYTMGVMMFFMGVGALFISSRLFTTVTFEKFVAIELFISVLSMYAIPSILYLTSFAPQYVVYYFIFFSAGIGTLIGMEIPVIQKLIESHFHLDVRFNSSLVMMMDYFGSLMAFFLFSNYMLVLLGIPMSAFTGGSINLLIAMVMMVGFRKYFVLKKSVILFTCVGVSLCLLYYFKIDHFIELTKQKMFRNDIIFRAQTPYQELILTDNQVVGNEKYDHKMKRVLRSNLKPAFQTTLFSEDLDRVLFVLEDFHHIPFQVVQNLTKFIDLPEESSLSEITTHLNSKIAESSFEPFLLQKKPELLTNDVLMQEVQSLKASDLPNKQSLINRLLFNQVFAPWFQMKSLVRDIEILKSVHDYSLFINGGLQFNSKDEYKYHEFISHVPMYLQPEAKNILIMGGGDGLALREINKYESVKRITMVDIDPQMTNLFKTNDILRKINQNAFDDPRLELVNQDAFVFAKNCHIKYDVIILDFPDPHHSQTAKLYTVEMYELLKNCLNGGGILITQSSSPLYDQYAYMCVKKSLEAAGFHCSSHHISMVSFLQWGFHIASATETSEEIQLKLLDFKEPVPTRWVDQKIVQKSMLWGKEFWLKYPKMPTNDLLHLPLVVLYNKDNFYLKHYLQELYQPE